MLGCAPVRAFLVSVFPVFVTSVVTFLVSVFSTMTCVIAVGLFLVPTVTSVGVGLDLAAMVFVMVLVSRLVVTVMSTVMMLVKVAVGAMLSMAI